MPGYVQSALHKFQHHPPRRRQHAPHPWIKPTYGQKQQFVDNIQSPPLSNTETTRIQAIVGTFLYYARAIDDNILVALNSIGTQQSAPTLDTKAKTQHLIDYISTHPAHTLRYNASDMIIHIDSNAVYLVELEAKSRAGGYFYLSNHHNPKLNGPIYYLCTLIKAVMSSAAESELEALFINSTHAIPIRHTLISMGHPQPPYPIKSDNITQHWE